MNASQPDWTWLEDAQPVTVPELSRISGMSPGELAELVDYGALAPQGDAEGGVAFSASCIMPLRKAGRLRADFDLDLFTVAIVVGYLDRIHSLERQVLSLQARMPGPPD